MSSQKTGRRAWLRGLIPTAAQAVQEAVQETSRAIAAEAAEAPPPRRRPPGAIDERSFLAKCTACFDCVIACPENSVHTLADHVSPGAGTPIMQPDSRPCAMCEGWPCAAACETGALVVPEATVWSLGTVVVNTTTCLPYMGPECGACARLCPGEVEALTLRLGRPSIDPDACIGCGLCIEACPVRPRALELVPLS